MNLTSGTKVKFEDNINRTSEIDAFPGFSLIFGILFLFSSTQAFNIFFDPSYPRLFNLMAA